MPAVKTPYQFFLCSVLLLCGALAACTPAYVQQSGKQLAEKTHLTDSIDMQRGNQRLLSRNGQVCLISDLTGSDAGLALLRSMQMAFSGYFVAVGIENEPMDYMRALASDTCPGAAYLFYVQPEPPACPSGAHSCGEPSYSRFVITIVNGDRSLLDRIKFSSRQSLLSSGDNDAALQKAFERLAALLTGAG